MLTHHYSEDDPLPNDRFCVSTPEVAAKLRSEYYYNRYDRHGDDVVTNKECRNRLLELGRIHKQEVDDRRTPACLSDYANCDFAKYQTKPPLTIDLDELVKSIAATLPKQIDDYVFSLLNCLNLINCGLTDEFFHQHQVFLPPALRILLLADNRFTIVPYERLTRDLRYGLDYLDLSGNRIGHVDLSKIGMVRHRLSLAFNTGIQLENASDFVCDAVALCGCDIGPEMPCFTHVRILDFSDNPRLQTLIPILGLKHVILDGCPNVFHTSSSGHRFIDLPQFQQSYYPQLENLSAVGCGISFFRAHSDCFPKFLDLSNNPIIHADSMTNLPTWKLDGRFKLDTTNGVPKHPPLMPQLMIQKWFDPRTCMVDLVTSVLDVQQGEFWKDMTSPGYMSTVFGKTIDALRLVVTSFSSEIQVFIRKYVPYHPFAAYLYAVICPTADELELPYAATAQVEVYGVGFTHLVSDFREYYNNYNTVLKTIFGLDDSGHLGRRFLFVGDSFGEYFDKFFREPSPDLTSLDAAYKERCDLDTKIFTMQIEWKKSRGKKREQLAKEIKAIEATNHASFEHDTGWYHPNMVLSRYFTFVGYKFFVPTLTLPTPGSYARVLIVSDEISGVMNRRYEAVLLARQERLSTQVAATPTGEVVTMPVPATTLPRTNVLLEVVARPCMSCFYKHIHSTSTKRSSSSLSTTEAISPPLTDDSSNQNLNLSVRLRNLWSLYPLPLTLLLLHSCANFFTCEHPHPSNEEEKSNPKKRSAAQTSLPELASLENDKFKVPLVSGMESDAIWIRVDNIIFPLSRCLLQWYWPDLLGLLDFDDKTFGSVSYIDLTGRHIIGESDLLSWFIAVDVLSIGIDLDLFELLPASLNEWFVFGADTKVFHPIFNFLQLRQLRTKFLEEYSSSSQVK